MSIPQAIKDYIDENSLEGCKVTKNNQNDLIYKDLICVPNHEHDLSESNVAIETTNLKEIGKISLLGAPNCTFYNKVDKSKLAYVITNSCFADTEEIHYYEF